MDLLQLKYFQTVAEMGNITRAAAYHEIPQPAMSRSISRLERELGVALFQRTNNRISLTQEGEILQAGVCASLLALEDALQQIRRPTRELSGEVRLLIKQHRTTMIDCISSFCRQYPHVSFRIFHEEEGTFGNYDLCISSHAPSAKADLSRLLVEEEIRIAVAEDHPLASKKKIKLSELKEEAFLFTSAESSLYHIINNRCERYGFQPRVFAFTDDLYCIERYVKNGVCIAPTPMVAWESLFREGVVLLQLDEPDCIRRTFLFQSSTRILSPAARAFRSHFRSYFQNRSNIQ